MPEYLQLLLLEEKNEGRKVVEEKWRSWEQDRRRGTTWRQSV
jgi:hypothetical protein